MKDLSFRMISLINRRDLRHQWGKYFAMHKMESRAAIHCRRAHHGPPRFAPIRLAHDTHAGASA